MEEEDEGNTRLCLSGMRHTAAVQTSPLLPGHLDDFRGWASTAREPSPTPEHRVPWSMSRAGTPACTWTRKDIVHRLPHETRHLTARHGFSSSYQRQHACLAFRCDREYAKAMVTDAKSVSPEHLILVQSLVFCTATLYMEGSRFHNARFHCVVSCLENQCRVH